MEEILILINQDRITPGIFETASSKIIAKRYARPLQNETVVSHSIFVLYTQTLVSVRFPFQCTEWNGFG
ncbi:MAG: hypothetical protein K1X61_14745 [Chitinophagales bacterium]|nr:hypothetical protein [Chitinophagales bacterium]